MNTTTTRHLVSVHSTRKGQRVTAITGSPKTKNLAYREGTVTDYTPRHLENGTHYVLEAVVTLDSGEVVRTHRLMETDTVAPAKAAKTVSEILAELDAQIAQDEARRAPEGPADETTLIPAEDVREGDWITSTVTGKLTWHRVTGVYSKGVRAVEISASGRKIHDRTELVEVAANPNARRVAEHAAYLAARASR